MENLTRIGAARIDLYLTNCVQSTGGTRAYTAQHKCMTEWKLIEWSILYSDERNAIVAAGLMLDLRRLAERVGRP